MRCYLFVIHGGIELEILGPFADADARDAEARRLRSAGVIDEEDGLHWCDVEGESIAAGDYSGGFFAA